LCERHAIASHQIWGHADIAPGRKRDPHVGFPWQRLAEAGFGLWPRSNLRAPPEHFDPWLALHLIGYDLGDRAATVLAFKRHFRAQEHAELDSQDLAILFDLQSQLLEMAHRAKWPVYPAIP
jgi:N-acetylmuramoyl-L-alanine amidase